MTDSSTSSSQNALRLNWSFGFNKDLIGGVHNLSTENRRAIFFTSAHTGVIYDYASRQQKLLQGHCHPISCCAVSEDKRWIVTADQGEESMIVVWDSITGNPIKTIFQPHVNGVAAIDISPDALFLVTLSAVKEKDETQQQDERMDSTKKKKRFAQELSVWEWTSSTATSALYTSMVATEDIQHCVRFNTYDIREIVTNGKQRVIFWNWQERKLLFYSPSLSQKDFRQSIGNFTQSLFVPDCKQALTGTEDGDLILWDAILSEEEEALAAATGAIPRIPDRKAIKIVHLAGAEAKMYEQAKRVALTFITDMDGYLVIGSSDGAVRFYDFDFRLVAWFEDMNAGPAMSVSFALADPASSPLSPGQQAEEEVFRVPDFIVATSSSFMVGMSASVFEQHEPEKRRGTLIMQGINDEIHGLAAHPTASQLALSCYSGIIQLWDYSSKRLVMMKKFDPEKLRPQCLAFSSDGKRLFVGFTSGVIKILSAQKLEEMATFRLSKAPITDIRVALDSSLFVAVDTNFYMGLWRYKRATQQQIDAAAAAIAASSRGATSVAAAITAELLAPSDKPETEDDWAYIGRCKSHSKPLTGLEFYQTNDGSPLLVSVSEDKTMVEYCLSRSSIVDGIVLTSSPIKIEKSGATPTALCWHPNTQKVREDLLIVANDEYKFKQWNASNKTCRKTTLGPTYGGPINRLINLPSKNTSDDRYVAYSTHEKVVGLLKLPLDGNPHKTMGLIAHPGVISNIDVTCDGKYLITAGEKDMVVNMWEIHTQKLDEVEDLGGKGLEPFLSLIEGGKDGAFYNEIVDYFYYSQIRVQGEASTQKREITQKIPLREIPNLMRALGFYPTEDEIQTMWSEMKYLNFLETQKETQEIDLETLIRLYINHRPVFGLGKKEIEQAFEKMGANPLITWELLEKILLERGEQMSKEELKTCLETLIMENGLENQFTSLTFADKVLGFDDYEATGEEQ